MRSKPLSKSFSCPASFQTALLYGKPVEKTSSLCAAAGSGWQKASRKTIKGDHADHIHANCDCQFAIRFNGKPCYAGCDPDKYKERYDSAEGGTWQEKLNSMRRDEYAAHADEINAQKREAYANRVSTDREESHKGLNRSTEIARSTIHSPDYGRRLSSADSNGNVTKSIISEARKMLDHRNGTLFEDLMFIDTRTGEFKTRTDCDIVRGVLPSRKMKAMLKKASAYTIAAIHNHPGSTAPSPADIHVLDERKNAYGIVLCHDGTIYKYSIEPEIFNEPGYLSAFAILERQGYTESAIKEYLDLAKGFGVLVEVL